MSIIKSEKLTFGDLDNFISRWAAELHDFDQVFFNQLQEEQKFFFRTESNQNKLHGVFVKLTVLDYQYKQLEQELFNLNMTEDFLDRMITTLENSSATVFNNTPLDCTREIIYKTALAVDRILDRCNDEVELLSNNSGAKEPQKFTNPVEQVANIMNKLLQALELVEMKMDRMKNQININHAETKKILRVIFGKNTL